MTQFNLKIDAELRDFLPGVPQTTDAMLEENLIAAGRALEPIVVWKKPRIVVDGHRRYGFCKKHNLPFDVREIDFKDRESVKEWMDKHQLQRRNLTSHDHAMILSRQLERETKRIAARRAAGESVDKQRTGTAAVAEAAGVSTRTVIRAKKYADALDTLPEDIRERFEEARLNHADVVRFAQQPETIQRAMLRDLDSGDFATLGEVMRGIGNANDRGEDDGDDDDYGQDSAAPECDNVSQLEPMIEPSAELAESVAQSDDCPKGGKHEWTSDVFDTFCSKCKEPGEPLLATLEAPPVSGPESPATVGAKSPSKPVSKQSSADRMFKQIQEHLRLALRLADQINDESSRKFPHHADVLQTMEILNNQVEDWKKVAA